MALNTYLQKLCKYSMFKNRSLRRTEESTCKRLLLCPKAESVLFLSQLFIIQEIVVRVCERSDNAENTKKSILISESNGVHLRLWDHMYP